MFQTHWRNKHSCRNGRTIFRGFNFMRPAQAVLLLSHPLVPSPLRTFPPRGIRCASGVVMLKKAENVNGQEQVLPVSIGSGDFQAKVLEATQPVLVEFWTPWSRSCQAFDPVLQAVARDCAGEVEVLKINADDSLDLSIWYDIQSVPTLLYFVQGKLCFRLVGTASKEAILAKLKLPPIR